MYACLECGKRLPPRATGGHREREYCSDRCRQRACRKQKKQDQEIKRLIEGMYAAPSLDPHRTGDRWKFERAGLLQRTKLLEVERDTAKAEVKVLETRLNYSQSLLTDREAEIIRLRVLLDARSKRKNG